MRDFKQTLEWYQSHQTTQQIGFNPDGMCLKVCRTARGIGSMFPTAKAAQDATPWNHRVSRVADLRAGMILYFDDPKDSNTAGHIVTMVGRVKDADPNSLSDVLVWTNSVQSGRLTIVRGDYFTKNWGDPFQFGSTWLNGQVLDHWEPKPKPEPKPDPKKPTRVTKVRRLIEKAITKAESRGKPRRVKLLKKMLKAGPNR